MKSQTGRATGFGTWLRSATTHRRAQRIAVAAGVLIGINLVARLLARWALPAGTDPFLAGAWSLLAMVVAVGVTGFWWTRRRRVPLVVGDLFFVVLVTTLVVTLVGPFVSGGAEFSVGSTLTQLALCAGVLVVGCAAGVLGAVALGLDPTSRAWKEQAARVKAKPGQSGARK
jgi:hypothetical protein